MKKELTIDKKIASIYAEDFMKFVRENTSSIVPDGVEMLVRAWIRQVD